MQYVRFFSPKGGVGCSTVAANYALRQAHIGWKTLIEDQSQQCDLDGILGLSNPSGVVEIKPNLLFHSGWGAVAPDDTELFIMDMGVYGALSPLRQMHLEDRPPENGRHYMVVRNDYLCLRAATKLPFLQMLSGVILVEIPEAALSVADVRATLGHDPVVVKMTPQVQRRNDAGLMSISNGSEFNALSSLFLTAAS